MLAAVLVGGSGTVTCRQRTSRWGRLIPSLELCLEVGDSNACSKLGPPQRGVHVKVAADKAAVVATGVAICASLAPAGADAM